MVPGGHSFQRIKFVFAVILQGRPMIISVDFFLDSDEPFQGTCSLKFS